MNAILLAVPRSAVTIQVPTRARAGMDGSSRLMQSPALVGTIIIILVRRCFRFLCELEGRRTLL
jgi:hypothetical protein